MVTLRLSIDWFSELNDLKFLIFVTAYNPLKKFDVLLSTLRAYQDLPGTQDVNIIIDNEHESDAVELRELLDANLTFNSLTIVCASAEFNQGYYLTWAHKPLLFDAVKQKSHDVYLYSENDMLFTRENFDFWYTYKDRLKKINYEPSFCRYEEFEDQKIPFDNYRKWQLNRPTKDVWGSRPHKVETVPALNDDDFIGFITLGNPYSGMMVLDQEMADTYINSISADFVQSTNRVSFRCWPEGDRSSLGTCFENLLPGQDHRRLVPIVRNGDSVQIASCGLIKHQDTKYSEQLSQGVDSLITVETMLEL